MDEKIPDRETYNKGMARTIIDKIFFLSHVDADVFVDFGCGNGETLRAISNFIPKSVCIGYDISLKMLEEAKSMSPSDFIFSNSLANLERVVCKQREEGKKVCLILSSVIHEIYSYSTPQEIHDFWVFANEWGLFDYIAIRDMTYSSLDDKFSHIELAHLTKIASRDYNKEINDFTRKWGSLEKGTNAIHFLLKYQYEQNWEREVEENYLPISFSTYFKKLSFYNCIYQHRYALPYIKKCVLRDFGLELKIPTHCQLIFERR